MGMWWVGGREKDNRSQVLVRTTKVCFGHKLVCVCVRVFWAWLSGSCSCAKVVVLLYPAAESEEQRCFIMASCITSGTAWHNFQAPTHLLPLTLLLCLQLQETLGQNFLYFFHLVWLHQSFLCTTCISFHQILSSFHACLFVPILSLLTSF